MIVAAIRQISEGYVYDLDRIAKGTMNAGYHAPANVYPIPDSYTEFDPK